MTAPSTPPLTESQRIKLLAQIKLKDTFDGKAISALNALSSDIVPHLTDHFMLVHDLRLSLREEYRRIYFDYGFVLFPTHKAFECFLNGVLSVIFKFEISRKKPIGVYLNYSKTQKVKILDEMLKLPWGKKISKDKWIDRWKALAEQWQINRNPLTHPEQERILNLTKAEQIAGAIIREMEISLKLFMDEFLDPLVTIVRKQEEKESARRKEIASKVG